MTITEFLLARIAEDEARARTPVVLEPIPADCWDGERVLAECEAKRNILSNHPGGNACWHNGHGDPCWDLRFLASVYADHPDYQQEWA